MLAGCCDGGKDSGTFGVNVLADTAYPAVLDRSVTSVDWKWMGQLAIRGVGDVAPHPPCGRDEPLKRELLTNTAPPPSKSSPAIPPMAFLGLPPPPNFRPCC